MSRFFTLPFVLFLSHGLGLAQQLPDLVAEQGYADNEWGVCPCDRRRVTGGGRPVKQKCAQATPSENRQ